MAILKKLMHAYLILILLGPDILQEDDNLLEVENDPGI